MTPSGLCNEPSEPALQDLANAVGLHRFLWTSIARAHSAPLLLVAGFDLERAAFQKALDDAQVAQIASIGQHLQALLANALLLNELELEKNLLQEFNDTLEQRVSKRTLELEQALARLREKDARIEEDLRQARSFQCGILPVITHWPCVEVEAHYHPLHVVGGDIYDVCEMAPHRYRVFIADATGHGIQASLRTIVLKGEYDRVKHAHLTPDRLLEALNAQLTRAHAPGEMLCTAVCFDIDLSAPEAPKLLCTSAAHPPLLVLSCGVIRTLASEGSFLGLEGATYGVVEATLEAGAVVIAYSDGLSDQLGPTNHEFDLQGALRTAGCDVAHTSLAELVRRLLEAFDTFRASVPVSDDVTLVAARISTLRGASNPGGSLENP